MTGKPHHILAAVAGLALVACAHVAPSAKEASMSNGSASSSFNMMPVKEWPLRFSSHKFSARCYDTLECTVRYAGLEHGDERPSPPSATYGPGYLDNWSGAHGMIRNFPPPAVVTWRSRDGEAHKAEIDIGKLFQDEVIRHDVPREEMATLPDGEFKNEPAVLLEVNDRIVRVYMRAHIPTANLQKPGNPYSDFRNDLVLVETYNF